MKPNPIDFAGGMTGLLLGGAVGDALGAPVEFLSRREILEQFGPKGIQELSPAYGRMGAITDDTQLTMFTLEGLIRAEVRHMARGICHPPSVVDHAYRRWLMTQEVRWEDRANGSVEASGWLISEEFLWSRRGPGTTCLNSLRIKGSQFGERARNDRKGAGGLMRVAPVGLYSTDPFQMAGDLAQLTHGHATSTVASGWLALMVQQLSRGHSFHDAARSAWDACRGMAPELDEALGEAFELAKKPSDHVPSALGEGWIAEEAAAIALWCLLTQPDPVSAIRAAVNIDGDSDTTGALVGQLLGAALGPSWIPAQWLEQLEGRAVLERLARDAEQSLALSADTAEFDAFWERYPGW